MNKKIHINAAISYLFLGWIFLLSRNPDFSHAYIRRHAKRATILHFLFIVIYILFFFVRILPIFNTVVGAICFSIGVLYLGFSSKQALDGIEVSSAEAEKIQGYFFEEVSFQKTEAEKIYILLSYIPYIDFFLNSKKIDIFAVRFVSLYTFLLGIIYFLQHDLVFRFLGLLLVLYFVFVAVWLFVRNIYVRNIIFSYIPDGKKSIVFFYFILSYLGNIFQIILGKKESISYKQDWKDFQKKQEEYEEVYRNNTSQEKLFLPDFFMHIPGISLIFLPFFLVKSSHVYKKIYFQTLLIQLLFIFSWFSLGFKIITFSLVYILLYVSSVSRKNSTLKIPGIYEITFVFEKIFFAMKYILQTCLFLRKKKVVCSYSVLDENKDWKKTRNS